MEALREYRTNAKSLADLLLYASLVDDGVMLLQDGALLSAWTYRGRDMDSCTHEEMDALAARLNAVLRQFGSGWMLHCDAIRGGAPGYPDAGAFPDTTTRVIDEERRQFFNNARGHFETEYFFTLTYLPPLVQEEKIRGFLFDGGSEKEPAAERAIRHFKQKVDAFENQFQSVLPAERLRRVDYRDEQGRVTHSHDNLCRYLRRCVTGNDHPFLLPEIPVDLHHVIGSQDFIGGTKPKIGDKHIRIVAINGFPRTTFPSILAEVDRLAMPFRWSTRAILLDPEQAKQLLDRERRKWKAKVRGFMDQIWKTNRGPVDEDAVEMVDDAQRAMADASSGDVRFCYYTSKLVLTDDDERRLNENVSLAVKTIRNLGFDCRVEDVNAIEAWRGSLPGDGYRDVRRPILHTINLAHLLPTTSVWPGQKHHPSAQMPPGSPPLLMAATTGATPFRLNLHVNDVGHTLIIGPTGAGKSTLIGQAVASFRRYRDAQVFGFDKDASLENLTLAAGGTFYDIGSDKSTIAFCPLAELETKSDRAWAALWIEGLCALSKLTISPEQRSAIAFAIERLSESHGRSITHFNATIQDKEVRKALEQFTLSGPLGFLLDAEEDQLQMSDFLCFDMHHLIGMGESAVVPVLLYLFRRIDKRLEKGRGRPTLIPIDEAWLMLKHPLFRETVRNWLKTLRKKNAAVILSSQSLSDIFSGDEDTAQIADVVLESCPTKILLANPEAENETSRRYYERLGLNRRELQILATATPRLHYYVVSPLGRRLIALGLGPVALAFVGANSAEDRQALADLRARFPDTWPGEWLRIRGRADWADYWHAVNNRKSLEAIV